MKVGVFDDGGLMGVGTALWVRDHGHEVGIVSAPAGFDALTPEKVADALHGCAVVTDLVHHPPAPATSPASASRPVLQRGVSAPLITSSRRTTRSFRRSWSGSWLRELGAKTTSVPGAGHLVMISQP